ncbi:phage terminase small subunit [Paenibacillus sp. GYB004]|uniref:phage terminase small subunit n=1 Tax=Paenibacillus sp. GYB004 TaxID=2994393 RepID=UPI002F96D469
MARERSPNRDKAFKLWCEGGRTRKLSSIAKELGIAPGLIRKWKFLDNWDELPDPGRRKRGAPKGNKNAVGNNGGAPKRNVNALIHGEYATIWEDVLDPEEQAKLMFVETDPLVQVENHIRFFELRERRMLQLRANIMNGWDEASIVSKHEFARKKIGEKPDFDEDGTMEMIPVIDIIPVEIERTVKKSQKLERILAIEEALTRVQDKKLKCIELKCKIEARQLSDEETRARIEKLQRENKIMASQEW